MSAEKLELLFLLCSLQ